jgi:hypothetical protein
VNEKAQYDLIPMEEALKLLQLYKERSGQRHSWGEVERDIQNNGHSYAMLVDRKKLRFWETGRTQINDKAFEAIVHFILSDKFSEVVPETPVLADTKQEAIDAALTLAEKYNYRFSKEGEFKRNFFYKLDGIWGARMVEPLIDVSLNEKEMAYILLYTVPVRKQDFALVHMQVTTFWPCPLEESMNLYSGYLFLNVGNEGEKPEMILHLWSRKTGEKQIHHYDFHKLSSPGLARVMADMYAQANNTMTDMERKEMLDVSDERLTLLETSGQERSARFSKIHHDNPKPVKNNDTENEKRVVLNISSRALKKIFDRNLWHIIPRNGELD